MPPEGISLPGVHWLLWERSDPFDHSVRVVQKDLARDLMVSRSRVQQVLADLVAEGRLEAMSTQSLYVVANPVRWVPQPDPEGGNSV